MARFKPGQSGNPAGKPAGAKNRTSEEIRQMILNFISENLPDLQANFNKLNARDKLVVFEKLLKYCLPTAVNELERLSDQQLEELAEKLRAKNSIN